MDPAWIFGLWKGGELIEVGTCGENGYFNDTDEVCTCTIMEGRLSILNKSCSLENSILFYKKIFLKLKYYAAAFCFKISL